MADQYVFRFTCGDFELELRGDPEWVEKRLSKLEGKLFNKLEESAERKRFEATNPQPASEAAPPPKPASSTIAQPASPARPEQSQARAQAQPPARPEQSRARAQAQPPAQPAPGAGHTAASPAAATPAAASPAGEAKGDRHRSRRSRRSRKKKSKFGRGPEGHDHEGHDRDWPEKSEIFTPRSPTDDMPPAMEEALEYPETEPMDLPFDMDDAHDAHRASHDAAGDSRSNPAEAEGGPAPANGAFVHPPLDTTPQLNSEFSSRRKAPKIKPAELLPIIEKYLPRTQHERVMIFGYYMESEANGSDFTIPEIKECYKAVGLDQNANVLQVLTHATRSGFLIKKETGRSTRYKLTAKGKRYIENGLKMY